MNRPLSSTRMLCLNFIGQDTALKAISQITENYGDVPAPGLPATGRHVPAQYGKGGSSMTRSEARQEDSVNEDSARPEFPPPPPPPRNWPRLWRRRGKCAYRALSQAPAFCCGRICRSFVQGTAGMVEVSPDRRYCDSARTVTVRRSGAFQVRNIDRTCRIEVWATGRQQELPGKSQSRPVRAPVWCPPSESSCHVA